MLDVTLHAPTYTDALRRDFHRDEIACVADPMIPEQLAYAQGGAGPIVKDQTDQIPFDKMIRDVRCWHGWTENRSNIARIMMRAGYTPPWFRFGRAEGTLPFHGYESLSDRTHKLCRPIVAFPK